MILVHVGRRTALLSAAEAPRMGMAMYCLYRQEGEQDDESTGAY